MQRFRRLQYRRPRRPTPATDLSHNLEYLRIVARHGGIAVAVHPGPLFHAFGDVTLNCQANSRQRRQQDMLIKRGLITKALRKVVDVILLHLRLFEAGRAAAGQTLTEAVPVILAFNAGLARAHQRNHIALVVAAPGENIYPVGKQRTCAIEFLTVQPPAAFNGRYAGENLPQPDRADFGPAAAHQLAVEEATEPAIARRRVRLIEAVFNEGEMRPQRLRQVGVGLSQLNKQRN